MIRFVLVLFFAVFAVHTHMYGQNVAVKNNLLYDLTLTPNLSVEVGLAPKFTMDLQTGLNLFTLGDDKKLKHYLIQPELRYWFCERFNGLFVGAHAHGGQFNVGGFKLPFGWIPDMENHSYEGWFIGGGASLGYQWILGNHWNLEASAGVGYARITYDKYHCANCGTLVKSDKLNYLGVTKAAISLIYIIK